MTEEIQYKTFRAEVKEIDVDAGLISMLIPVSTASMDRDNEIIEIEAWKKTLPKFKKRPILLSSHNYGDLRKQIGEFKKLKLSDEGLMAQPHYYINEGNEEADWAFNLAQKGMAAFSVGFIPLAYDEGEDEKSPRRTYKEVELLEISQVVVPSNRDAIQGVRAKSVDPVVLELCDDLECSITKPEETEEYYRVPVPGEEGKHEGHRIRTIDISKEKGIKALYCGEDKVNITYLFSKEKEYGWTMSSAEEWVKEHSKNLIVLDPDFPLILDKPDKKLFTQEELRDEIDYVKSIIDSIGIDDATILWGLVETLDDMPESIQSKIGAVLNQKNKDRLEQIKTLAQQILDSAEHDAPKSIPELTLEEINEVVSKTITSVIRKAQGKLS